MFYFLLCLLVFFLYLRKKALVTISLVLLRPVTNLKNNKMEVSACT